MVNKNMIVVSLRSKGLAAFNKQTLLDIKGHATNIALDVLDVVLAAIVTIFALSWTGWISVVITIIVVAASPTSSATYTLESYFLFFSYVVLPMVLLTALVIRRRDDALARLSRVKSLVVAICLAGSEGPAVLRDAHEEVRHRAFLLLECLHRYLQHKRPYTHHFFMPWRQAEQRPSDPLLLVTREVGVLLRRVHRAVRDAHVACQRLESLGGAVGEGRGALLSRQVTDLHDAVEGLSAIKEMRTPVVLRAMLRWYSVLIIPVFLGPFTNLLRQLLGDDNVTPGTIVVLSQISLMVLLDTLVGMEDPFDDTALDSISLFEMMDHVSAMTADPDGDAAAPVGGAADYNQGEDYLVNGASPPPLLPPPSVLRNGGDVPQPALVGAGGRGGGEAAAAAPSPPTGWSADRPRFASVEMLTASGGAMPPMPLPLLPSAVGNALYGVSSARWHDTMERR